MTVDVDDQHYLAGITSFAIDCGWVVFCNSCIFLKFSK